MSPLRRIRNSSARELRLLLFGAVAVNVAALVYIIAYMPLLRLQPICTDQGSSSIFVPNVEVEGEMAIPFFKALQKALADWNYTVSGGRIYLTVFDWLSRDQLAEVSHRATYDLLAEYLGAPVSEIRDQRLGIPEFDEVEKYNWPPCDAMRKLAIVGGEWAIVGPKRLEPDRAKGRVVPLPHLTDPLLFEPAPRRAPGNDASSGG